MDKGRRQELVAATSSQWADIAGLAQGFIPEQLAAGAVGWRWGAPSICVCLAPTAPAPRPCPTPTPYPSARAV
jgi:hypothetical protein